MTKIEILQKDKKGEILTFVVKGINNSYANSIRRSVSEIPILAIEEVEFIKNDSALYDEMIAHRLGLVPLKTDKTFTLQEECTCKGKGCAKCTATFKLSSKGPGTVLSKELKSKAVDVVYENIPIVILEKGQEIELIATAKLGKAIEHTKYSPGLVWFRSYPIIEIDKNCNACNLCVEKCPKGVLAMENKKIIIKDITKCDLCEACVEACNKAGKKAITVKPSETDFIFSIESWGQIPAREIFIEACKVLEENLKLASKELEKAKSA